jgi:hypothetical protein
MPRGVFDYIKFLSENFFRWWWAVITGVASIGSWIFVSNEGVKLSRILSGFLILFLFGLVFFVISVFIRGWILYRKSSDIKVICFQKNNCYETEYICIFECIFDYPINTLIELLRFVDGVQVSFAAAEILEKNSKGQYQAKIIWTSPIHMRDYKQGIFSISDIQARSIVSSRILQNIVNEQNQLG